MTGAQPPERQGSGVEPYDPPPLDPNDPYDAPPSPFPHPQWTVGVVLILGAVSLFLGIFGDWLWLLAGSPFILALLLWLYVRLVHRGRSSEPPTAGSGP